MTTPRTRLLALLGHPVAHSRSPAMMTSALAHLGVDAAYLAFDTPPGELGAAVRGLHALSALGANVTLPHKTHVLAHCASVSHLARTAGAANTLVFTPEGPVAHNTDAPAVAASLADAGTPVRDATVAIIGSGGAARAAALGVTDAGARRVLLFARRREPAEAIAAAVRTLNAHGTHAEARALPDRDARALLAHADVLIQATPLGMTGHSAADEDPHAPLVTDALSALPRGALAFDLVYTPRDTAWLKAARSLGLRALDGTGMLAHQGALALSLWLDREVPVDVLRRFLDSQESAE